MKNKPQNNPQKKSPKQSWQMRSPLFMVKYAIRSQKSTETSLFFFSRVCFTPPERCVTFTGRSTTICTSGPRTLWWLDFPGQPTMLKTPTSSTNSIMFYKCHTTETFTKRGLNSPLRRLHWILGLIQSSPINFDSSHQNIVMIQFECRIPRIYPQER